MDQESRHSLTGTFAQGLTRLQSTCQLEDSGPSSNLLQILRRNSVPCRCRIETLTSWRCLFQRLVYSMAVRFLKANRTSLSHLRKDSGPSWRALTWLSLIHPEWSPFWFRTNWFGTLNISLHHCHIRWPNMSQCSPTLREVIKDGVNQQWGGEERERSWEPS